MKLKPVDLKNIKLDQAPAPAAAPQEQRTGFQQFVEGNPIASGLVGLGGGLVKGATGVIQTAAQLAGADELAQRAGAVTQDINRDIDRLGTAGAVGGFVGEVAPYVALPAAAPTLAGRVGLGAAGGALAGGLQAQENPDLAQRASDALTGAAVGAVIPVGLAGVGKLAKGTGKAAKSAYTGAFAREAEQLDEAANVLREQANSTYKAMRDAGVVIKPEKMVKVADEVDAAVKSVGDLDPEVHKKTLSVLANFKEKAAKGPLSLEQIDLTRQLMKEVAGGFDADAMRARTAIEALDNAVLGVGAKDVSSGAIEGVSLLKQARKEYAQRMKFETVAELVKKAEGEPQKLQTAAKNFLANKKKMRGFTGEERRAIADLADRGGASGVLKLAGTFGFDPKGLLRNQLSGVALGGAAAGTIGAPAALTIAGIGTAARQAEKFVSRGKAENLLRTIETGAYQNLAAKATGMAKPNTMLNRVAQAIGMGTADDVVRAAGSKEQAIKTVRAIGAKGDDATRAEASQLVEEINRGGSMNANPSTPTSAAAATAVESQRGSLNSPNAAAAMAGTGAAALGAGMYLNGLRPVDLKSIQLDAPAPAPMPMPQPVSTTFIIQEEGFRPTAYKDSVGVTTIGYGFNLEQPNARDVIKRVKIPETYEGLRSGREQLSEASARKLFDYKHRKSESAAAALVPNYSQLGENQRAALTSMAYHMGGAGLRQFKKTLNYLKEGNAKAVENQLLSSLMAQQTPARAQRTALMLAYNLSPQEAEQRLLEQGRISPQERQFAQPAPQAQVAPRQRVRYNDAKRMVGLGDA